MHKRKKLINIRKRVNATSKVKSGILRRKISENIVANYIYENLLQEKKYNYYVRILVTRKMKLGWNYVKKSK